MMDRDLFFYMLNTHFLFVNFTFVSYLKSIKVLIFLFLLFINLRNSLIICTFAKSKVRYVLFVEGCLISIN